MTLTRRFPAVVVRAEPPAPSDALQRMDIAAFVGLAERGPLHTPVAIETPARFREIFGEAPRLAWDPAAGIWQTACLAAAVADFFAQGGRRCRVVRVAGPAAAVTQFPIAGLLHRGDDAITPAAAQARSAGTWADSLSAGASLNLDPLRIAPTVCEPNARLTVTLGALQAAVLQAGDLLQLDFAGPQQPRAYLAVDEVDTITPPNGENGRWQTAAGQATWFRPVTDAELAGTVSGQLLGTAVTSSATLLSNPLRLEQLDSTFSAETGEWLTFTTSSGDRAWLLVDVPAVAGLGLRAAWWESAGTEAPGALTHATRVTMNLAVSGGEEGVGRLSGLAFVETHPRFWGALPSDETLFESTDGLPEEPGGEPAADLWQEVSHPRFPLAGPDDTSGMFIPLGLEGLPVGELPALTSGDDPLVRDGLAPTDIDPLVLTGSDWAAFFADMYLDPDLDGLLETELLSEALEIRYPSDPATPSRYLSGLHSVLPFDEVSMIALTDAAHRGWRVVSHEAVVIEATEEPPAPEPCEGHELFVPCPPSEVVAEQPAVIEDAPPPILRWENIPAIDYDPSGLERIHVAAVRMSAARADMVSLLGLPLHYRASDALDFRRDLGRSLYTGGATASYGALYHPWFYARQGDGYRVTGPEGAVAGIIAARSLARGAWVAPANRTVREALALPLEVSKAEQQTLFDEAVNVITQSPWGFQLMGADTLSEDEDLRPLGVRRLLILLRRLALREGQTYVFEPNSPAFRRRVALGFERHLGAMFARGAFAGKDPSDSYQVVVDETVNGQSSVEHGNFVVELKVAPSQPLTFITVRLVQAGAGALTVQEA